jgi:hypothetical protein
MHVSSKERYGVLCIYFTMRMAMHFPHIVVYRLVISSHGNNAQSSCM